MRKAALITHDFSEFGGSTIVVLEIANYLSAIGYLVTIRAERFSSALKPYLNENISVSDKRIDICDYDLVWSQHGHFCLNTRDLENVKVWNGIFISAHLSSSTPAEIYHYPFASRYAGAVVFNAKSVEDELTSRHQPRGHTLNIKNAAPIKFHTQPQNNLTKLKSLLIVSNHMPPEIGQSIDILRSKDIKVNHVGIGGQLRLIEPRDIASSDAVISIGKTVQYSLVGGKPVYCYDQFGGPGWLSEANFELAEIHNFSGRCTRNKKSALQICDEITHGYSNARDFTVSRWQYFHDSYNLHRLMDQLLKDIDERGEFNYFNSDTCLEEIDSMRGPLMHLDWIWRDVFGGQVRDEFSVKNADFALTRSDSENWILGLLSSPWKISYWNRIRRRQRALRKYNIDL